MDKLNIPEYSFKIITEDKLIRIFDVVRMKWVTLTPEEWVRQHILMYLIHEKAYPAGLIQVEANLKVHRLSRRADIVIYSQTATPLMIIECKASKVKLTQSTLDQVARYNITLKVPFLLITNGLQHYCCKIRLSDGTINMLETIPEYQDLKE